MAGPIEYDRLTVAQPVEFEGVGLHSGVPVKVTVHPGENGIGFRYLGTRVLAEPQNVSDTTRCTRLGDISTVEHLMSAFAGCGITDVEIDLTAGELPGMDGSAQPFVAGIRQAGTRKIGTVRVDGPFARVFDKSEVGEVAIAHGEGWWRYTFATDTRWPGEQVYEGRLDEETYANEVAPARTFCFEEELPALQQAGLGQGLDASSALVLGPTGYLNACRFQDEPPRHKLLDLIGDLYLSGVPIGHLDVVAARTGHTANIRAATKLRAHVTVMRV